MGSSCVIVLNGCPYCAGQKILKEDSFAVLYSDLLTEYSTENKEDPFELSPGSNKRLKWVCKTTKIINGMLWFIPEQS